MLGHEATSHLLAQAGILLVESLFVPPVPGEARRAAERLLAKRPVVLKLLAPGFTHKTDAGLLELRLGSAEAVAAAAAEMLARLPPGCVPEGFLVQPMVSGGVEVFIGAQVDPQFGPVVAFGPGGTLVELMGGVDFLRPPFSRDEALGFVERNRMFPILRGARGAKPSDLDAIADALLALGALMAVRPVEIVSVDLNPFVVFADGEGGLALDARIEEAAR